MKALKAVAAALLLLCVLLAGFYYAFPKQSARVFMTGSLWITWMRRNDVEVDGYTIHTLDGGHGEPLIILHGIFSRKENWLKVGRKLDAYTRVIIPDLPGFGDNAQLPLEEYSVERQAQRIVAMLDKLGIEEFHISGSSMGGAIAALIARHHPDRVLSLAFLGSPFGVTTSQTSEHDALLASGAPTPLIATDAAGSKLRDAWLAPETPYFHDILRQAWPPEESADAETKEHIWKAVTSNPPDLLAVSREIAAPAIIFWCKQDRIFHPDGAGVLAGALQKAHLYEMEDCGHSPVIDKSNWLAKRYTRDVKLIEAGVWPLPD